MYYMYDVYYAKNFHVHVSPILSIHHIMMISWTELCAWLKWNIVFKSEQEHRNIEVSEEYQYIKYNISNCSSMTRMQTLLNIYMYVLFLCYKGHRLTTDQRQILIG